MGDEEGPPPPNLIGSSTASARVPLGLVWQLLQDANQHPKLYDPSVLSTKSLARDRESRREQRREVRFIQPNAIVRYSMELQEPVEEDKPKPPSAGGEEAVEEPVEEAAAAGGEEGGSATEEAAPAAAEEPPAERWTRCQVTWNVSSVGSNAAEMATEGTTGSITLCATEAAGGDATAVDITVACAVFTTAYEGLDGESKELQDWQNWTLAWVTGLKDAAEKMLYLCPSVTKSTDPDFFHAILRKAQKFKFINLQLSRSPSALGLLSDKKCQGSLGFFQDRVNESPIPIGLAMRPHSSAA